MIMVTVKSNIDLGSSFEILKRMVVEIEEEKIKDTSSLKYVTAYGGLVGILNGFFRECTGEVLLPHQPESNIPAANADDLKDINI